MTSKTRPAATTTANELPQPGAGHQRGRSAPAAQAKRKPAAAIADAADAPPQDMEEFRYAMARKIATFLEEWRRCEQRTCRRARRCIGRDRVCVVPSKRPPPTPEQEARARAAMYYALQRRAAEIEAEERE